jgi:hypothetical protein
VSDVVLDWKPATPGTPNSWNVYVGGLLVGGVHQGLGRIDFTVRRVDEADKWWVRPALSVTSLQEATEVLVEHYLTMRAREVERALVPGR